MASHKKKQEEKQKRLEERRKAREEHDKKQKVKTISIVVMVVAVLAVIGFAVVPNLDFSDDFEQIPIGLSVNGDHMKGNPDAKHLIIEYSDFQCPACKAYEPLLDQVIENLDAKLIYRHYPLKSIHRHATIAAQASEAASIQGKFWEYHDVLFETQSEWSNAGNPRSLFEQYAGEVGLDVEKFKVDMESQAVVDIVDQEYQSATKYGFTGTPTIILNGKTFRASSYQDFERVLQ